MRKKIKTVIASVLKPIDDTRMFEKFGLSMQQSNKYEVNIIGFSTKNKYLISDIHFIPAFFFSRLSIRRFLAPLKFFWITFKIKPDLIIITTHELILPAILYKLFYLNCKLVYDVQENYFRNFIYHAGVHKTLSYPVALWIRAKELLSTFFFSLFLLAEEGYTKEFSFSKKSQITISNKFSKCFSSNAISISYVKNTKCTKKVNQIHILYSGTIHEAYGITQSINLAKNLLNYLSLKLVIIGSSKNNELLKYLAAIAAENPWLEVKTDTVPIPHVEILEYIRQADFGIVSHQPIPSIRNCFPTRIYELMAFQKPILLQDHAPWTTFCSRWDSAIPLDFNNFDAKWVADQMLNRKFYKFGAPDDIFWESEEQKLLSALGKLFN